MAYNAKPNTDSTSLIGTKKSYKPENKQILSGILLVNPSYTIATETLAETENTYLTALKQTTGRAFLIKAISETEDQTTDASVQEFPSGDSMTIMSGDYKMQFYCNLPDGIMKNWYSLNDKDWSCYLIWKNNSIQGRKDSSGVIFYPIRVKELKVVRSTFPNGSEVKRLICTITFSENEDLDDNIIVAYPTSWNLNDLQSLRYVNMLNFADATGNEGTVDVLDDAGNGEENLVVGDFTASLGNPSSITDNGNGNYTLSGLTAGSNTCNLVAAASISKTYAMIESAGASDAATITV